MFLALFSHSPARALHGHYTIFTIDCRYANFTSLGILRPVTILACRTQGRPVAVAIAIAVVPLPLALREVTSCHHTALSVGGPARGSSSPLAVTVLLVLPRIAGIVATATHLVLAPPA